MWNKKFHKYKHSDLEPTWRSLLHMKVKTSNQKYYNLSYRCVTKTRINIYKAPARFVLIYV